MRILEFFSKYQKLIIFGCLLLVVLSLIDKVLGVATIFVFFLSSISLFFIGRCKEEKQRRVLGALFLIVFFLHILAVLFMYYAHFQPFSGGGGDYNFYQQQAQEIAGRVQQGNFSLQDIGIGHYYPVIVGYIYVFTVPSMLIGQILNAWLVAIIVIFVYLIVREMGGSEKGGFLTGLIASVYPSLAFFGSLLLKDALVALLSMVGLLLTIKIIKSFSFQKFLYFFVILTSLIHFRFYIGYALMFGFVISWFLISNLNLKKRVIYGIVMVFILGFSPQILGNGYYGFINLKRFLNRETITIYREVVYVSPTQLPPVQSQTAPQIAPKNEPKTSSIVIKTGFENPITFVKNTLLSFTYSFLGPFPWQLSFRKYIFVLPEMIAWYFLLFFIMKGIIKSIKKQNKIIFPLIVFSILVIGALSLFITIFGIITRIRIPAFLALLCLFPLGFEKLKNIKIPFIK